MSFGRILVARLTSHKWPAAEPLWFPCATLPVQQGDHLICGLVFKAFEYQAVDGHGPPAVNIEDRPTDSISSQVVQRALHESTFRADGSEKVGLDEHIPEQCEGESRESKSEVLQVSLLTPRKIGTRPK
jgi:hypothetical protein